MSRPSLTDLVAGQENAQTTINANKDKLVAAPAPLKEYADYAALSAVDPALYDRCLAVTVSPPMLWISTGTGWVPTGIAVNASELTLAGATVTFANAFPAGVRRIGVAGRVTELITSGDGGTDFLVGDHGASDPNRYADSIAFALGTVFKDVATADPGGWSATAQDVVVTCAAGGVVGGETFSAGKLRLYAFYIPTYAPLA